MSNKLTSAERTKKWRQENPEKVKAYADMRYKRDIVKVKERRAKNKPNAKKYAEEYRKKYGERLIQYDRDYRVINNEIVREKSDYKLFGIKREIILERDHWKCTRCGMKEYHHKKKYGKSLSIHHIDGQGTGKKEKNNRIDNLVTLCCVCHTKTHEEERKLNKTPKNSKANKK